MVSVQEVKKFKTTDEKLFDDFNEAQSHQETIDAQSILMKWLHENDLYIDSALTEKKCLEKFLFSNALKISKLFKQENF